jgi:hypothetical protein
VAIVLVLVQPFAYFGEESPQAQAERFVAATWTYADEVAKMLVIRDFFEVAHEMGRGWAAADVAIAKQQNVRTIKMELTDALEVAAGTSFQEVAASEKKLENVLHSYRTVVARRYRLSWHSANSLIESQVLAESVSILTGKMRARCEQGASSGGDDFYTAPRPALPQLDLGFYVHATFDESGRGGVDQGRIGGGGAKKKDRDAAYGIILGASTYCGAWYAACAVGGTLIASAVFDLLDKEAESDRLGAIARAEAYRLNARAVAADVNVLYRKHCGYTVEALEQVQAAVNMTADERREFLATADTEEFRKLIRTYEEEGKEEREARCRVAVARYHSAGACPAAGSAVEQPKYDNAPEKCSAAPGSDVQCPQRMVKVDNGCRVVADGKVARFPVIPADDGVSMTLASTALCTIELPFDTLADEAKLRAMAARRSDPRYMETFSKDLGRRLAVQITRTLADGAQLGAMIESGEEELDKQQQFALTKIVRLLHFVRVRKRLMQTQSAIAAAGSPAGVQQVVDRFARESGRALTIADPRAREEILEKELVALEKTLSAADPTNERMAMLLRDARVSALQLRLLAH